MTTKAVEPRVVDQPVFFPPEDQRYFGIVSTPAPENRGTTGVILLSGTHSGSTTMGRNRLWVGIARSLAAEGFTAVRLDYAGLGESLTGGPIYDLELPAVDAFHAAKAHLASLGMQKFVVVGTCFGSRTALAGAAEAEDIAGVLLLAPPVRNPKKGEGGTAHLAMYASTGDLAKRALSLRTIRKLVATKKARSVARRVLTGKVKHSVSRGETDDTGERRAATEAADGFLRPLRTLAQHGVPVRMVFGTNDIFWTEYEHALQGRLGQVIDKAGDTIQVDTVPGVVRGFTSIRIQEASQDNIIAWAKECS